MSKNLKVSANVKLEIVKRAINGESYLKMAQEYFPACNKYSKEGSIRKWTQSYQSGGVELLGKSAGMIRSGKKTSYTNCSRYRTIPQYLSKDYWLIQQTSKMQWLRKLKPCLKLKDINTSKELWVEIPINLP